MTHPTKRECCVNCKGVRFPGGVCINPTCLSCHSSAGKEECPCDMHGIANESKNHKFEDCPHHCEAPWKPAKEKGLEEAICLIRANKEIEAKIGAESWMTEFVKEFPIGSLCCNGDYCLAGCDGKTRDKIESFIAAKIKQERESAHFEERGELVKRIEGLMNDEKRFPRDGWNEWEQGAYKILNDLKNSLK